MITAFQMMMKKLKRINVYDVGLFLLYVSFAISYIGIVVGIFTAFDIQLYQKIILTGICTAFFAAIICIGNI